RGLRRRDSGHARAMPGRRPVPGLARLQARAGRGDPAADVRPPVMSEQQPAANASATPEGLALEATAIRKSYPAPEGRLEVLKGVDLAVRRGTILAIVGASGSGKSTLLNILGTLDRADTGTVAIGGKRVHELKGAALARVRAREIGFVFQFHHLLPEFTAEENVMMPLRLTGRTAKD